MQYNSMFNNASNMQLQQQQQLMHNEQQQQLQMRLSQAMLENLTNM